MERNIEIFVKVYPAGVDKDGKYTNPVKVILAEFPEGIDPNGILLNDAKAFRDRYVRQEYKFCRQEEEALLAAVFRRDRIRCKNNLMLKRAEFARSQGYYGPDNRWTKIEIDAKEILV